MQHLEAIYKMLSKPERRHGGCVQVLDSIALNCSKQVRRQLADKKWSRAIFEGCNNLPEAQPPLHQLLANWAVLYRSVPLQSFK